MLLIPLSLATLWFVSTAAFPQGVHRRDCTSPSIRVEWSNLSESQKQAYLSAERCLYVKSSMSGLPGATNRLEDLAAVHQIMSDTIHSVGQFLPWHRYMLHAHETLLRTECDYDGPMTWWDESKDAGAFDKAELFSPEYFGLGPLASANENPACIVDGVFARMMLSVGPGPDNTIHCLSRAVNDTLSTILAQGVIDHCNDNTNYTNMWKCVDGGPHAAGHDAVGGVMADVDSSPGDPVFYMHHTFLDRNWADWQASAPANLYAMGGNVVQGCENDCLQTTLNYTLSIANIIPNTTIDQVMDIRGGYLCYSYDY